MRLLANMITSIKNAEMRNKKECLVYPSSKLLIEVLKTIQRHGYIGEFEVIDDGRGSKIRIQLFGRINDCGVIKPRLGYSYREFVKLESKYLPSRDIGIVIVTTSKGVMTTKEAFEKRIGGVALAYVY
jgi:SSU ribosomal protein S8P